MSASLASQAAFPGQPPVSVVIPAHDEEAVLGRCLHALLAGARPHELDIVVVCNGCTDRTVAVARSWEGIVRVIETPVPSKSNALNLGDRAVRSFPRFYVDADVVLPLPALRRMAERLGRGGAAAAAPTMDLDLTRSTWPVRAFYAIWTRMPFTREGMVGVGVYALSEEGRRRFDAFPDVIADDGYVRALFGPDERVRVEDARVRVVPPSTYESLVRIRARSRLGGWELGKSHPELVRRPRGRERIRAWLGIAARPWLWPQALVYLAVNVASRRLARRRLRDRAAYVWDRDETSRRAETVSHAG
jgi:glycosyltransferase involved in cell wall biosynthesis